MTTYTLIIDEEQRAALLRLMLKYRKEEAFDVEPGGGAEHPLAYWIDMLASLPKDEAENPKVIHGFCL